MITADYAETHPLDAVPSRREQWSGKILLSYILLTAILGSVGAGLGGALGLYFAKGGVFAAVGVAVLVLANGAIGAVIRGAAQGLVGKNKARQVLATILGGTIPGSLITVFLDSQMGASFDAIGLGASVGAGIMGMLVLLKGMLDLYDQHFDNQVRDCYEKGTEQSVKGDPDDAERILRDGIAIAERHFGTRHPLPLAAIHGLANHFRRQRQFNRAEPLYLRVMPAYEAILGNGHPCLAGCLYDQALLYSAQENPEAGLPVIRRVLAIREKFYGPESMQVGQALNLYAQLSTKAGKENEAVDIAQRAMGIQVKKLGENHPDVAATLATLADAYRRLKKFHEAEQALKRLLEMVEAEADPPPAKLATRLIELGEVRLAQNKLAEAEPLYSRALKLIQMKVGPDERLLEGVVNGHKLLVARAAAETGGQLPEHLRALELIDVLVRGERGRLREVLSRDPDAVRYRDANGWTALHWASFLGHEDMVRSLLIGKADYRAGSDTKSMTALDVTAAWSNDKVVLEFIQSDDDVDWNTPGQEGMTAIFWAVRRGRDTMVDKLVELKADVNRKDDLGRTPLHMAAFHGQLAAAGALIAAGANVNVAEKGGMTPLHVAAGQGQTQLVECLMINGADWSLTEKSQGLTPLKIAEGKKNKGVVRALKKLGAKA